MKQKKPGVRHTLPLALATAALLTVTACSGSSDSDSPKKENDTSALPSTKLTTLRQAWAYQDQTMDPATFYGGPGFSPMGALYEGLVGYAAESVEIEPQLATDWTISDDGLTYTFTLREGATFHDGTPVDAEAVKFSFQRFSDLEGSPSYMLDDVESMDAPDPQTFVMHLKAPSNPMLDYLASYVGPKVMSPTLMEANSGEDDGAEFLSSHDAGSGPYELTEVVTDKSLTLEAYADYWGAAPTIGTIQIQIIPDISTQVLSLEKGDVDMVTAQVPANLASQLRETDGINVTSFNTILKALAWVKDDGFFADPEARKALAQAIDKEAVAKGAYGEDATASTNMIPSSMQGGDVANDDPEYDPSVLAGLVEDAGDVGPITIGYYESLAEDALAAELMQTQLQAAGLDATVRSYGSEFFGFGADPTDAPEIMVLRTNADAASPAAWMSGYYKTGGGLTLNGVSVPEGDAALTQAINEADPVQAEADYETAAQAYADSGYFITLADPPAVIYTRDEVGPVSYTQGNPFGPTYALTGSAGGQ
ncbi:ABC transporter substrate-binding protein [Nocardioides halotolerans]|uniref:ABC transporter substrate-binding protein n=1 Tax=Nocardioides halotolerans TaxID=433660 RepID=UPI000424CD40|nr:ABC transporter substrate-binding protein [Nocardioides halotolerans]